MFHPYALFIAVLLVFLPACSVLGQPELPSIESAHWVPLESRSEASLRGISVVSDKVIWASGSQGTVLRSLDGGERWERLAVPGAEAMDFRDVVAFDEKTAFVMGITEPACLLRTLDGGKSWQTVFQSQVEGDFFDSLAFFDRENACVFGDPQGDVFSILISSDGGSNWERVPAASLPPALPGEAAFAASGTCISALPSGEAWIGTGGEHARVLRSSDFGQSWSAAQTPMISGGTSGIYSVAFRDAKNGIVVGGDYSKPEVADRNVALTRDGGESWECLAAGDLVGGYRSAVAYVPGRSAALVALGRAGCDYSLDAGRSWRGLGEQGFYALGFSPGGLGFAVGADGSIARLEFKDLVQGR